MSNEPDKSKHRASFAVIDVASVSPTERRVRVQVEVSPSRWGFTSGVITILVPEQGEEAEIRRAVCAKVRQETGLNYLPDELHTPENDAEAVAEAVGEMQQAAEAFAAEPGKRKRKGRK